jgi:hypothetical protein
MDPASPQGKWAGLWQGAAYVIVTNEPRYGSIVKTDVYGRSP